MRLRSLLNPSAWRQQADACPLTADVVLVADVNGTLIGPTEDAMARHAEGLGLDEAGLSKLRQRAAELAEQTGHAKSVGFWLAILEQAQARGTPLTDKTVEHVAAQIGAGAQYPGAATLANRARDRVAAESQGNAQLCFVPVTGGFGSWRLRLPVVAEQMPDAGIAATFSHEDEDARVIAGGKHFLYGDGKVRALDAIARGWHQPGGGVVEQWDKSAAHYPVTPQAMVLVSNISGEHDERAFRWLHAHGGQCILVREPGTSDAEWKAQQHKHRRYIHAAVEASYEPGSPADRVIGHACARATAAARVHARQRWKLIELGTVLPTPHELDQMIAVECDFGCDVPVREQATLPSARGPRLER